MPLEHIASLETLSVKANKEVLSEEARPSGRGAIMGTGVATNIVKAEEGVIAVTPGSGGTGSLVATGVVTVKVSCTTATDTNESKPEPVKKSGVIDRTNLKDHDKLT